MSDTCHSPAAATRLTWPLTLAVAGEFISLSGFACISLSLEAALLSTGPEHEPSSCSSYSLSVCQQPQCSKWVVPQFSPPTVLTSHSSQLLQLSAPTALSSHSSQLPQIPPPTVLSSHSSQLLQFSAPTVLSSHSSQLPQFSPPTVLTSHSSHLPQFSPPIILSSNSS